MRFTSIEVLRFPLMALVVFVHVLPYEVHPISLEWQADAMFILVSEIISHHLGRVAVPCFFLFSGYFFFLKISTFNLQVYTAQLRSRLRTLIIPYLLWNALFILVIMLKNLLFIGMGMGEDELFVEVRQASLYYLFWGKPLLFPFWYLRDLICMTLLSPLFYLFFRYTGSKGLLILLLVYLLVLELYVPGLSSTAFLFFGAGAFLGMNKYDLGLVASKFKLWILLPAALICLVIAGYYIGALQYEYMVRPFNLLAVLVVLRIGHLIGKTSHLKTCLLKLGSSVFFIYAIHGLYIINWCKGTLASFSLFNTGWGKLLAYFIAPVLCLWICLFLYRVMRQLLPKPLALLTGGRMMVEPHKRKADEQ